MKENKGVFTGIKNFFIGDARHPEDPGIFHKISLIAFFAWIGLGSDGLSSSCYGPEEAYLALSGHHSLGVIVALLTVATILIISASYSQIIEFFPAGGGGYLVASKLLSPAAGAAAGSALVIDYILTISISIASGTDALFSFLPQAWAHYKILFALAGILVLTVMNLRGVKESIEMLTPLFLVFIITHVIMIAAAIIGNLAGLHTVAAELKNEFTGGGNAGLLGVFFLVMRAYSMGAGTFTGIEAVSNGTASLAEPRVKNAKTTMRYMALSLSFMVLGIMLAYTLLRIEHVPGKTLNAVLFERTAVAWGSAGAVFVYIALLSEAALLFVAAQTGFIDGPRVLANMAADRWIPARFALLSDRLVTRNGIIFMSAAAVATLLLSGGSVKYLVVLYSINVFITFSLSQLGMVVHWIKAAGKEKKWLGGLVVNGAGFILTSGILTAVVIMKFEEGGWITLAVTTAAVLAAAYIKVLYKKTERQLASLDALLETAVTESPETVDGTGVKNKPHYDEDAKTGIVFVNGFNGLGINTALSVIKSFGQGIRNFVFVEIGVVDSGVFKGKEELDRLKLSVENDVKMYSDFMMRMGYYAEGLAVIGIDAVDEALKLVPKISEKFRDTVFFGGQIVFKEDSIMNKLLHNYIVFRLQQSFYKEGIPFVIMPVMVY